MGAMNKLTLSLIAVLVVGAGALGLYARKQHTENRATILAQSTVIAQELVSRTNSPHLLFPGSLFQHRIAEFLKSPAQVEAVRYGDEARPPGQDRASSRIYLVNEKGARLALRLKPEGDMAHFRLLGWWIPTTPPPPET